jgi:hypothetical protein
MSLFLALGLFLAQSSFAGFDGIEVSSATTQNAAPTIFEISVAGSNAVTQYEVTQERVETAEGPQLALNYRPLSEPVECRYSTQCKKIGLQIDVEGALLFQQNNIVQSGGRFEECLDPTRFNLADSARGPFPAFRAYLTWMITKHHSIRALYAPLSLNASFVPTETLVYEQMAFMAGQPIDVNYTFNSYRLSYIYHFDPVGNFEFRLGFTAKIRDAKIGLSGLSTQEQQQSAERKDFGFVPLLNFGVRYNITEQFFIDLDVDGLAAKQGRAIDAALKAGYKIDQHWGVNAGYRVVEGGVNIPGLYNCVWLNYFFLGLSFNF